MTATSSAPVPVASILFAGDRQLFGEGLVALIAEDPRFRLVACHYRGLEALAGLRSLGPDLALLDQRMASKPGGEEICSQLRADGLATRCVLLLDPAAATAAKRAFQAGAKAGVFKDVPYEVLADILIRVAAGEAGLRAAALPAASMEPPDPAGLSRREREVLRLVGGGLTSKQIAESLFISPRTVDSHRFQIMQKLEIANGPGLVRYALENGIV